MLHTRSQMGVEFHTRNEGLKSIILFFYLKVTLNLFPKNHRVVYRFKLNCKEHHNFFRE